MPKALPLSARGAAPPSYYRAAPSQYMADAFGTAYDLPPEMRDMPLELLRTEDRTRYQVAMAMGIQDFMNARKGVAVPVRTYIPSQALYTQWKRGPGSATTGHFQPPGAGIPGAVQASANTGAEAVLLSTSPRANVSVRVESAGQMADRLGASRMVGQPPRVDPGPLRLRPVAQRNAPVASAADLVRIAQAGSGQDPRGNAASAREGSLTRAWLWLKEKLNG